MDICNFADNLVLELAVPNSRRRIKVITTGEPNKFKCVKGVAGITIYDETEIISLQDCKHLVVDSVVNGFVLEKNMLFQQGFMGLCRELSLLYQEQQKKEAEAKKEAEVVEEVKGEVGVSAADAI